VLLTVKLYNTETKAKTDFIPRDPDHVTMYVCGRNITDIDDKINKAAAEQGVDISVITEKFTQAYHQDLAALGVLAPDVEPKVTDHIVEIHQVIQSLIDKGHAYEGEGNVLFSVSSFNAYGDDQPGWDSPWGRGRPGWHIECSAMSAAHLGDTMDIHGGGHDLIFPHHENERAQSCCANGADYVRYWMHNGFINIDKEKMSKSIGNVLLVRELLEQAPGEAIRYVLLSAHYRAPLDWNDEILQQARSSLDRLYGALRKLNNVDVPENVGDQIPSAFREAMLDDFNTPKALSELFALSKQANVAETVEDKVMLKAALIQSGEWLGLLQGDPEQWFAGDVADDVAVEIDQLIAERQQAKVDKNWARADEIRDILADKKVVLEDNESGTTWRFES